MLPATTRLMSADDHMIEPPDLWVDRVPARFRDDCPRIVEVDGRQAWRWQDELTYIPMGSCRPLPGFDEAGYPPAPGTARFDEIRPGCYDPVERIKDMDIDGVWGQLCFPNFARFAGHRFYLDVADQELGLACLRTYNDYLLDEWCATAPSRLFGAVILPLHDLDAAVAELERVLAKGAKAIAFSENPTVLGLPSVHTDHWDPLWAIANAGIGQPGGGGTRPSQLFAQHVYVCLVDEHFALRVLGDIPVDNLLWEGDYPHGDGLWPHNHSYLEKALADVPEADALKIAET